MSVARKNLHVPELGFNLVVNRTFTPGIPAPAGNRDAPKSRKSRKSPKNSAFQSRLSKKIAAALKKQDDFEASLKQAIFGSRSEAAPGGSQRPTSTLPATPSPAPTPCGKRRGSGNRCGHNPEHPNFAPPNPKRPKFTQKSIEKIYDAYTDLSMLLTLNFHIHGFKVRSERREAYSKVLAVVLERMDLATLRVGFPTENGFFNYTLEYLATRTGMGLRRVARAVRDLKKMGFLIISQIRERLKDGSYRSFSAIKIVSTTLFDALGLRGWLDKERAKARERLRIKQKAYEKACAKRGATMIKRLTAQIAGMAPTSRTRNADEKAQEKAAKNWPTPVQTITATTGTRSLDPVSNYLAQLNPEAKALISKLALAILTEHPDWSRDNIYAEAKKLLPGVYRNPQSLPT